MTKSYERGDKTEDHSFRKSKLGEIRRQNKFFFVPVTDSQDQGPSGALALDGQYCD